MTNKTKLSRRSFLKLSTGAVAGLTLGSTPFSALAQNADGINVRYVVPQWASSSDRRAERAIAFRSVVDLFNARHAPNTVSEILGTGDVIGISQNLDNGDGDAYWVEKTWYVDWQAQGRFADLSQYLPEGEEDKFFPVTTEYLRSVNGELGALWHNTDTPLFYYNTALIDSPPTTWEELIAWAAEWRETNGNYAFTLPYQNWMQMFGGNLERLGGSWVDDSGAPALFESRDLLVRLLQPFVDLVQNDLVPSEAVLNGHNDQMPLVYTGDAASFFGNSNLHIRALQPNLPPEEYSNWAATTLPYPEELTDQQRAYTVGGWVIAVARNENDPEREAAAAQWVMHATNATSIAVTTKAGGWVPTRPEILENDPFYSEDTIMQTTLAALNEHGYVPPAAPAYQIAFTAIGEALQVAASGQSSLDDALNAAEERINREYADLSGS